MSVFVTDMHSYNIATQAELSEVLSHFSSEFILSVIEDNISNKFAYSYMSESKANIVEALEQNFKTIFANFESEQASINDVRVNTYKEIIQILSNNHELYFNDDTDIDYYSAAYYLYDFLVSNFSNYIILFLTNFICKEKNNIYESLHLSSLKKNKDMSTAYGKKLYNDPILAVINANIEFVVNSICQFDIDFYDYLTIVYGNNEIANFIAKLVTPQIDFFKSCVVPVLKNPATSPVIISELRLNIHRIAVTDNNTINIIKK